MTTREKEEIQKTDLNFIIDNDFNIFVAICNLQLSCLSIFLKKSIGSVDMEIIVLNFH